MNKEFNIIPKSNIVYNDSNDKFIKRLIMEGIIRSISMNEDTYKYIDLIKEKLGIESKKIEIINPHIEEFGIVNVMLEDGTAYRVKMLVEEMEIDTKGLDLDISVSKPKFLIMCRNTVSILMDQNEDCSVSFKSSNTCYSYKNIKIAVCEFLNPGIVFSVTE